jgi:hypothetical protein
MPMNEPFKFWQPPAIAQIKRQMKHLKGMLLCDMMGLGKTWILVGLFLSVS